MSSREDKWREAQEYYDATHIKGWEYQSRSMKVLKEEYALKGIDDLINNFAREGWRLHTIQFSIETPFVYLVFERRREYKCE